MGTDRVGVWEGNARINPKMPNAYRRTYELFMVTYVEPGNEEARARLITWGQESPAHWRAFLALDQYLAEVKQMLEGERRGSARRE